MLRRQFVQQFLRFRVGQEVGYIVLDDLGQMRDGDCRRVDHGVTPEGRFFALVVMHPHCRQAEGRLDSLFARQFDLVAARIHDKQHGGTDFSACGFNLLDADHVGIRRQLHVVLDTDGWHDEAHLIGELTPQSSDLLGQGRSVFPVHKRQQRVSQFEFDIVKLQRGRYRLLCRPDFLILGRGNIGRLTFSFLIALPLAQEIGESPVIADSIRNGSIGMPGSSDRVAMSADTSPSATG